MLQRLAEAVQGIIASSPRPPIIIIQGDHGPGSQLHWDYPQTTNITERLSIFNAWYVPTELDLDISGNLTSINTFQILLNGLFGAGLPEPDPRLWFARMPAPYIFLEVVE